jgi:Zn-dependent protease
MDFMDTMAKVMMIYVPFLFALCFHEYAHGWVAKKLGDPTAEMLGRVSMNPLVHIDLFGTVIFPLMAVLGPSPLFFGWAKPVPVSVNNLKDPKKDMFWIALAGPASNFFLAVVGFIILGLRNHMGLDAEMNRLILEVVQTFIFFNLFLAVFNLIPVHPLDGGKIIARFLPIRANLWLEDNASMISMALFGLIMFSAFTGGSLVIVTAPVRFIYNVLATLTGYIFMF